MSIEVGLGVLSKPYHIISAAYIPRIGLCAVLPLYEYCPTASLSQFYLPERRFVAVYNFVVPWFNNARLELRHAVITLFCSPPNTLERQESFYL